MMTPGPGRVTEAGLQQSMATREPNLEPRRETMCLLGDISQGKNQRIGDDIPNMAGDLITLMVVAIHQDPLDEIVAILVTSDWTR